MSMNTMVMLAMVSCVSFLFVIGSLIVRDAVEKLSRELREGNRLDQVLKDWNNLSIEAQQEAIRRQQEHERLQAEEQAKYDGGGW